MKQEYFVVVLAHSLRGRLRRIHIPTQAVYVVLAFALFGCFSMFGIVASYTRMALKVANYNALRREADGLRVRYQTLLNKVNQTDRDLASLQMLAKDVSAAYGIKDRLAGPPDISAEGRITPTYAETLEDYDALRHVHNFVAVSLQSHRPLPFNARPSLWPVEGRIMGAFGHRLDPFSGEGAFHKGVDISSPTGTPVKATAEGVVVFASWEGGYGRLVIVDHGGGVQTYYAHLSEFSVHPGQVLTPGEIVGLVGSSGRVTAPHLHYEVHVGGAAVNPSMYLANTGMYQPPAPKPIDHLYSF